MFAAIFNPFDGPSRRLISGGEGSRPRYSYGLIVVAVLSLLAFPSLHASAQSLGEIARQHRLAKQGQPPKTTHVYTEDDLAKEHILTPEDQAHLAKTDAANAASQAKLVKAPEATQSDAPNSVLNSATGSAPSSTTDANLSSQTPPTPAPSNANVSIFIPAAASLERQPQLPQSLTTGATSSASSEIPLGDIARFYRAQREQRAAAARQSEQHSSPAQVASAPSPAALDRARRAELPVPPATRPVERAATSAPSHRATAVAANAPRANRNPSVIGQSSRLTAMPGAASTTASTAAVARRIRVRRGDTLWGIAKQFLGAGSRWPDLLAANPRIGDPRRLQADSSIALPMGLSATHGGAIGAVDALANATFHGLRRAPRSQQAHRINRISEPAKAVATRAQVSPLGSQSLSSAPFGYPGIDVHTAPR